MMTFGMPTAPDERIPPGHVAMRDPDGRLTAFLRLDARPVNREASTAGAVIHGHGESARKALEREPGEHRHLFRVRGPWGAVECDAAALRIPFMRPADLAPERSPVRETFLDAALWPHYAAWLRRWGNPSPRAITTITGLV